MCFAVSIFHLNVASYYEVWLALFSLHIALSGVINFHYLHPLPEKKKKDFGSHHPCNDFQILVHH